MSIKEVARQSEERRRRWNRLVKEGRFSQGLAMRCVQVNGDYVERMSISSIEDVWKVRPPAIVKLAKYNGNTTTVGLIHKVLRDMLQHLRVKENMRLGTQGLLEASKLILDEYPQITLEVIHLSIKRGVMGRYGDGKVYNRVDINVICNWLNEGWYEMQELVERRHSQRTEYLNDSPLQFTEQQAEKIKEDRSEDIVRKLREAREELEQKIAKRKKAFRVKKESTKEQFKNFIDANFENPSEKHDELLRKWIDEAGNDWEGLGGVTMHDEQKGEVHYDKDDYTEDYLKYKMKQFISEFKTK